MKKVLFNKGDIDIVESDKPTISEKDFDNVILKIVFSGLCGSDIHRIKESKNSKISLNTLGHEIVGRIDISNNSNFLVGKPVVLMPIGYCGICDLCKIGNIQFCENPKSFGKNIDGGFTEYIKTPIKFLYKIDNLDEVFVLTDSLACIIHTDNLIGGLKNKKICIIGDGSLAEIAVRYFSLNNEIINFVKNTIGGEDIFAKRINIEKVDFYNNKFDYVIECVGGSQDNLINVSGRILKFGGTLLVLGVYDKDFTPEINLRNIFFKEIKVIGSNSFIINEKVDEFHLAIKLIESEKERFKDIITHKLKLEDFEIALELLKNKKNSHAKKIVFI